MARRPAKESPAIMDYAARLASLPRQHDFLVGIDSDGCVFDSMEIKHKECFCPAFIKHYGLQPASKYARQVWEFVNLYSRTRGCNRFLAVQRSAALIDEWDVFAARGVRVGPFPSLDAWIAEESKLGNPALEAKVAATNDAELERALAWSVEVNSRVADMVKGVPPFPQVRDALEKARASADVIVVSQTPVEALVREWREHEIDGYVDFIAGQEAGTKSQHLELAAGGHYEVDRVLMLGDAIGDLKAARDNDALFFPVVPGREEESWARFCDEGIERFLAGAFAGEYQRGLIAEFESALAETPPWKSA